MENKIKEKVLKKLGKKKDGKSFGDRIANNIIDLTLAEVMKLIDKRIKNYKKLHKTFPKNPEFLARWEAMVELKLQIGGEE